MTVIKETCITVDSLAHIHNCRKPAFRQNSGDDCFDQSHQWPSCNQDQCPCLCTGEQGHSALFHPLLTASNFFLDISEHWMISRQWQSSPVAWQECSTALPELDTCPDQWHSATHQRFNCPTKLDAIGLKHCWHWPRGPWHHAPHLNTLLLWSLPRTALHLGL
jgi:hypothetical protein